MKIIYLQLLLLAVISAKSQNNCPPNPSAPTNQYCEEGQGISTDPNNLINVECPDLINNFEWRVKHPVGGLVPDEYYYIYGSNVSANPVWVRNPFNGPIDANYIQITANHGSNNKPEDGWELLKVEFGAQGNIGLGLNTPPGPNTVTNARPKLPYMILYNRYSGTMRFFGALMEPDNTYETVRIELRIPSQSPNDQDPNTAYTNTYQNNLKATNLLSIQGKSIQPLDKESDETAISVFVKYTNNPNVFFWFVLPVAYDPCLCNSRSQLDVSFRFVQTANIDITGSITGSIKTQSKGNQNYAAMVFGRIIAAGVSGATAIATGGAVVNIKAFTDLIDIAKDHPSRSNSERSDLTTLKNYITCTSDYAKILEGNLSGIKTATEAKQIASAQKIIDGNTKFMSSLVKGCGDGDKGATTISGDIKATGTFTMENEISATRISLALPGSNWTDKTMQTNAYTDNNGKIVPAYPTYNERLGTFALLKTPRVELFIEDDKCGITPTNSNSQSWSYYNTTRVGMKLMDEDLKYVFNPNLNINPAKTKILARFVIDKSADFMRKGYFWEQEHSYCDPIPKNNYFRNINMSYSENSNYKITTPFISLDYLTNLPMQFSWLRESSWPFDVSRPPDIDYFPPFEEHIFIQFSIVGESYDLGSEGEPNKFTQILTFPVDLIKKTTDIIFYQAREEWELGIKEFNQNVSIPNDISYYFEGPVYISAELSTGLPTQTGIIYSLKGFILEPGAKISPNIKLITGPPVHFKRSQPSQTFSEVNNFCNDPTQYKAQIFSPIAKNGERKEYLDRQMSEAANSNLDNLNQSNIILYPNPAKENFTVEFDSDLKDIIITVRDLNGKQLLLQKIEGPKSKTELIVSDLSSGVYIVTVISSDNIIGRARLVKL